MMSCSNSSMETINKGNTPITHHTFAIDGEAVDLTGLDANDLTMYFFDEDGNAREGTGTWTIVDANAGQANYLFSIADSTTVGEISMYPAVPLPSETVARDFPPQKILITNYPKPD